MLLCACMHGNTNRFGLATLSRVHLELNVVASVFSADDLSTELEFYTLLLEQLLRLLGNLGVHAGATNLVQEFDDGNLGTQSRPYGTHLKTDDTTTNDDQLLGDLLEGQGAGAGDNALLVDLESGERRRFGTGSDKDVLADHARLAAIDQLNLDLVLASEGTGALDVLDAVLLEEELDTLGKTGDGGVLGLHHSL